MSTSKKKGLGRGLTALFGDQTPEVKKKQKTTAGDTVTSCD